MGRATSEGNEVEDETPFRYAHAEIRTRVVVICDPNRYQFDHGGAMDKNTVQYIHKYEFYDHLSAGSLQWLDIHESEYG